MGSPLLLLGPRPLRNPVYGGLAVSSLARVEHPDDRHPDECCRAVLEPCLKATPSRPVSRTRSCRLLEGKRTSSAGKRDVRSICSIQRKDKAKFREPLDEVERGAHAAGVLSEPTLAEIERDNSV